MTLPYRSPELLLGCTEYSIGVDMWSVGCIFAELFIKQALFSRGDDEKEQIYLIFQVLNPKKETELPFDKFPKFSSLLKGTPSIGLKAYMENILKSPMDANALDLLGKMLAMDPSKRISAKEALKHV